MSEPLGPERAVRLLRAKGAQLEGIVLAAKDHPPHQGFCEIDLIADIALIALLLADEIERSL